MSGHSSSQAPGHNNSVNPTSVKIDVDMHDETSKSPRSSSNNNSGDTQQGLFRPYVANVSESVPHSRSSTNDISERNALPENLDERQSRPQQRVIRRAQSKSIPRANQQVRGQEKPGVKNKQSVKNSTDRSLNAQTPSRAPNNSQQSESRENSFN